MRYLVLIAVLLWGVEACAHAEPRQSQDAVVLEFIVGSISALGGGLIGAFAGSYLGLPAVEACKRRQGSSCEGQRFCFKFNLCDLNVIPYMVGGYAIGVPIGATIGVALIGYFSQVSGNLWLAAVGAVVGEAVSIPPLLYASSLLQGQVDANVFMGTSIFLVIPVASSLGATMGFNMGVRHYTSSPLSWSLLLIVWRF